MRSPGPVQKEIYAYIHTLLSKYLRLSLSHCVSLSDLTFFHPSCLLFCDTQFIAGNKEEAWVDSGNRYRSQCQPLTSQPLTLQVTSLLERHIIFLDVSKIDFNLHFLGCSRKASIPLNNLSHLKLPVSAQFFHSEVRFHGNLQFLYTPPLHWI